MQIHAAFQSLLTTAATEAAEDARALERKLIRATWVNERMADLKTAQKRADEAWHRFFREHPDEDDDKDFPDPPEQAEADAILEELWAVAKEDRWPRHLYFTL